MKIDIQLLNFCYARNFLHLRYLKWIRSTVRNVQVMRGCVAFVTDAYKGADGRQQHFTCFPRARFGLARTVWHLAYVLTFISRSHFLVRSTLHASASIREFYFCPNTRNVSTREADLIPGNNKHTWRLPRAVIATSNFGNIYSPYIREKKKTFSPVICLLYHSIH